MPNIPGDIRSYRSDEITRTLSFPKTVSIGIIGITEPSQVGVSLDLSFPIVKVVPIDSEDYRRFKRLINGDYETAFKLISNNLWKFSDNQISILDVFENSATGNVTFVVNLANFTYNRTIQNCWATLQNNEPVFSDTKYKQFPFLERYYPIDLVLLSLYLINFEYEGIKFGDLIGIKDIGITSINFSVNRYYNENGVITTKTTLVPFTRGAQFYLESLTLKSNNISSGFEIYSSTRINDKFTILWEDYKVDPSSKLRDFSTNTSIDATFTVIALEYNASKSDCCFSERYEVIGGLDRNIGVGEPL